MKFFEVNKGQPPEPIQVIVLQPSAWCATYGKRPTDEVAIGLRLPSERELQIAHAEASKEATANDRDGEAAEFRFGEALVCWSLAAALCDVNDATKPYFECADEEVRQAFTPETLRHLWHELEQAQLAASPVRPGATDEEVEELAFRLVEDPTLESLPAGRGARVRRLLRVCREELREASPDPPNR
jgi:hypothetical protein